MPQARNGDTVRVNYTGSLEDGSVFDTSLNRAPLEFTIGAGRVIPGFEQAVVGMSPGESKTERIPHDQAYGPHQRELECELDRSQVPPDFELSIGQQLELQGPQGESILVRVTALSEAAVTLDANHPLAGHNLVFEIELLEILAA